VTLVGEAGRDGDAPAVLRWDRLVSNAVRTAFGGGATAAVYAGAFGSDAVLMLANACSAGGAAPASPFAASAGKLPPSAADWAHAAGISRADTAQAVKVLAKGMGFMK
jgi:hypothetical protein